MSHIIPIIVVFFNCILGALAAFLLKKGSNKRMLNLETALGLFLYVIGAIIMVITLKYAPVSVVYPVTSATYIWSFIFANRYLNEKIGSKKVFGLSLITIGIVFMALST